MDLKAAFDSMDRSALWLLRRSFKIVDLMKELYTDTVSSVRVDGAQSVWFPIYSGVRQGCPIAPSLVLPPMDWILQRTVHKGFLGATLGSEVFTDLDYADDVALLAEMLEVLLLALEVMNRKLARSVWRLIGTRPKYRQLLTFLQLTLNKSLLRVIRFSWLTNSPILVVNLIVQAEAFLKC